MEKEEGSSKLMATTSSMPRFVRLFRVCRAHLEARRLVGCAGEPVPSSKGSETFTTHRVATFATHVFCPEFRVTVRDGSNLCATQGVGVGGGGVVNCDVSQKIQ